MRLRNFVSLLVLFNLQVFIDAKAQSPYNFPTPCYLVIVGSDNEEFYRVNGPTFQTSATLSYNITYFGDSTSILANASKLDIEIKPHKGKRFHPVRLQIPENRTNCNLLLARDPSLKPPLYFRAEWISQEMMDEYFFPGTSNHRFDTILFSKVYKTSIPSPTVNITFKKEPFTAELMHTVNPFNGQYLELDFDITPAKEIKYTTHLKAVEISFIHPEISNIDNRYILSQFNSTLPRVESYFFWPSDFTLIPGAKIIFKCLYWYRKGFEILESGMVTKSIEF